MFERRPIFGLLIGLTICISIWRINNVGVQEPAMLGNKMNLNTTNQLQPLEHNIITSWESTAGNDYFRDEKKLQIKNENTKKIGNTIGINSHQSILNNLNSNKIKLNSQFTNSDKSEKDDIKKLINLNNFEFLINQLPCPSQQYHKINELIPPLILILVHSAPKNYKKRLLIRETWGSWNKSKIRLIFLFGTTSNVLTRHNIELENKMFSDIVQGNFIDNYRNMTYKHVMALKWFKYYCPNAKYLLKADDDVFINTPQLIEFFTKDNTSNQVINKNNNNYNQKYDTILPNNNLLFCIPQWRAPIKRSYRSKWRVSQSEIPGRYYPPYCPGYFIIYSSDVVFKLYKLAQKTKYFWIDDVHITGTIAQLAKINITISTPYILNQDHYDNLVKSITKSSTVPINNNNFRGNEGDFINNDDIINYIFLFTWPDINEPKMEFLWNFVSKNQIKSIS